MSEDPPKTRILNPFSLLLIAVLIGIVAGLGAAAFRAIIAFFHNLLFLGTISFVYDANQHTPASPWGVWVIFVPVVGAAIVALLIKYFAPEAKGHGVPEVMDAIYYRKGIIRPIVALIKSLASGLSIGSGGSIGREGPIIQIGSSFGSTLGQMLRLPVWQRITLIAAGAGGGIAATFNTPVGGVLFAAELMMHEVSVRTLVPVAIATATATYVGRFFFGPHPSFIIPAMESFQFSTTRPQLILLYALLGVIMGGVSTLLIKGIYGFEGFFDRRLKGPYILQHMAAMLVVGICMYILMVSYGHYYIEGVGYSTVQDILTGNLSVFGILIVLFVMKWLATSLTLGSGASGGIFSPSLFLGATVGGAYGVALKHWFPGLSINPPAFAVVGMASAVGGATGAAMASIVMIFEMTLDYNVILPLTTAVAISYAVRRALTRDSIYTLKLTLRGERVPEAMEADIQMLRRASEIMQTDTSIVQASSRISELKKAPKPHYAYVVTDDSGAVAGVITRERLDTLEPLPDVEIAGDVAYKSFILVAEGTLFFEIVREMQSSRTAVALVSTMLENPVPPDAIRGVITREEIIDFLAASRELF